MNSLKFSNSNSRSTAGLMAIYLPLAAVKGPLFCFRARLYAKCDAPLLSPAISRQYWVLRLT